MPVRHWILVAGTGRRYGLPPSVSRLAEELGRLLAERSLGLVVGGWPGVDHVTARAYASVLRHKEVELSDRLIQIVAGKRPEIYPEGADYPDFKGGHVIEVPRGVREWIEALKYSDAAILLGGEGGTLETFQYAVQEQRPCFPAPFTGGDAMTAFYDCLERWEVLPYHGISRSNFEAVLSMRLDDLDQTTVLAEGILSLLKRCFDFEAADTTRDAAVFVSYAHGDRKWLTRLRSVLRPIERTFGISVWDDQCLNPGASFEIEIGNAIASSRVAILLVSDAFLESEFIREKEMPLLFKRQETGEITILWLLIQGEAWRNSAFASLIEATEQVDRALISLPSAEQQDALVKTRIEVARLIVGKESTDAEKWA